MSDFKADLWGLRFRAAAGIPSPAPTGMQSGVFIGGKSIYAQPSGKFIADISINRSQAPNMADGCIIVQAQTAIDTARLRHWILAALYAYEKESSPPPPDVPAAYPWWRD